MKRLRHPVRAIREPFGTAGLIVACVALIAALAGGAYAATGLNGKQKKEVEKIAKKFAGKPGAAGAVGPAGPQGAPGAKGDTGAQGANGEDGDQGVPGAEGEPGPPGPEGSPWTVGGALPPGETQTGTYLARGNNGELVLAPISFALPVEGSYEAKFVDSPTSECPGLVSGVPTAKPGFLCVYKGQKSGSQEVTPEFLLNTTLLPGTSPTGTLLFFGATTDDTLWFGPWAVTAPE